MPRQPAALGTARLGNFRLGYASAALMAIRATRVRILLAGLDVRIRISGLTIHDILNDAPNTCRMTIDGSETPSVGQALQVWLNSDAPELRFSGTLQTVDLSYEGKPTQLAYPCTAIDDTARANRKRPFGTWVNISATTIATYLTTTYAPGLSTTNIAAALPAVSIIFDGSADFIACLARLADAIGGYCKVENLAVYLFLEDTLASPPLDLDSTPGRFLNDPPITVATDMSQLRTRVYGKGHGAVAAADVLAGETILPIADAVQFNLAGGRALAGTTADGAQSQILTYAGVQLGGGGSLVGPGAAPSTAPALATALGSGLGTGWYGYGVVDVTAAGKTVPGPIGTIAVGPTPAPPAPGYALSPTQILGGAGWTVGDTVEFKLSYSMAAAAGTFTQESAVGASTGVQTLVAHATPPYAKAPRLTITYSTDTRVRWVHTWVSHNGGAFVGVLVGAIANVSSGGTVAFDFDGQVTADTVPTAAVPNQITVTGIALGASPTTSREVYRTVVQATQAAALTAQLKLLTTIANNTSTGPYGDSTADGSLGANAPTGDASGLTLAAGQVNAGSTSLLTASAAPFSTTGGWALLPSGQAFRYTGLTGNTLTGIPASGAGAILTTVVYGSQILPAPALTGVTGVALAMAKGSTVAIWVQRDDLTAQAAMAAIDGGDGIYEYLISDERRGEASLIARCDADLALFSMPIVTVNYATRDPLTRSGKTIHVDLTSPPIGPIDLTIQDVTISEIDVSPGTAPRFSVTASTVRFSLEDVLRRMAA